MQGKIFTPEKPRMIYRCLQHQLPELLCFLREYVVKVRTSVEWAIRALKAGAGRLSVPLPSWSFEKRQMIIELVCSYGSSITLPLFSRHRKPTCPNTMQALMIHNLRIRRHGANQLRTLYGEAWARANGMANNILLD